MRKPAPRGQRGRARPRRPSSSLAADREALLTLLVRDGVLRESPAGPVPSGGDVPVPWRLDSPRVTLTTRGAELAGRCLLHLLERFEGRQLATFGTAGVPLLQSCVLLSRGRYQGLLVPREREADGSPRPIEGRFDPDEPVLILEDSASSVEECLARLEEAGLFVEGGVCLVRFGYDDRLSRLRSRGFPVLALYDIWEDFVAHMSEEEPLARNPTRILPPHELSPDSAPDGLHPTELARHVIAEALRTGKLLRPPRRIEGRYAGAGGVRVSVRLRDDIYQRQALGGFWSFPGEKVLPLPAAIAQAALLAAEELSKATAEPLAALEQSTLAVTFFSALEECGVGQLDNERYGIVVRSRERPFRMGGALPRMPGIAHEGQQLHHARTEEGRLLPWEPFILYRHKVQEAVEPGASPQAEGVPRVEKVLPAGAPPKSLEEGVKRLTPPLCKFLLRHLGETARYEPFTDTAHPGLGTAQLAHQAWAVARAHRLLGPAPLGEGARTLLTALTSDLVFDEAERVWIRSDQGPSIAEVALVLLALLETGDDHTTAATLAATLWSSIGAHGRFTCHMAPAADDDAAQDSGPGLALLALARAAEEKVCAPDAAKLAQARRFYCHRFRHKRHGSQVAWLAQAAVAWWRVDRDAEAARLAFEICDAALTCQSERTGAFIDEHSPDDPGYATALYLEALAAAATLAAGLRDRARERRYLGACARGVAFLDSLVIQERDAALLPNARQALGGVRASPEQAELRVELVQHSLLALLGLRREGKGRSGARRRAPGR